MSALRSIPRNTPQNALRTGGLVGVLLLGLLPLGAPTRAQPAETAPDSLAFRSVHEAPPPWLAERIERTMRVALDPAWKGPETNPELLRLFLYETYEHVREVVTLTEAMGGRTRGLPGEAPPAAAALRGIHDFGERVSLARLEAFVAEVEARPLKTLAGEPAPVPEWLRELARDARARGERTVDIGKLSPYVAAGLARNGNPDPYALELHRLSPHHAGGKGALIESIADRVNAMRQVRVYSPTALPFAKIESILRGDLGKGIPVESAHLIERAIRAQRELERTGKVNPYYLKEGAEPARNARPADRFRAYRRADGTLEWGRLTREGALRQAGGLAHFGLALFLKEVAVVAASGDRARIEEFFDGLLTTDFYANYGLFVLGARAGEVAYARYLERFVRPRFVSGILKTNLVLATGLALPQLIQGTFSGKAFAISLGSLGLSAAAVRSGVAGIRWVHELKRGRQAGGLARAGAAAGRLARLGGWFYTAAELAVVLYLAEELEERVHAALDERAARRALGEANRAFLDATRDPAATPASVTAAGEALDSAWTDYRDFLYRPLFVDEARLAGRLERIARAAKLQSDERSAALTRLGPHSALARSLVARYGSLEAYAQALSREGDAAVAEEVAIALASYERSRAEHLAQVYAEGRRGTPYLSEVEDRAWLVAGGAAGAPGDPWGGRRDLLADLGRRRARARLSDALERPSGNRLEAYADQAALLEHAAAALQRRGRADLAAPLAALRERTRTLQALDTRLYRGEGFVDLAGSEGASATLEEALGR